MLYRTLYLVRHGQYDTAATVTDGGSLTDLGKVQAEAAGKALEDIPINMIYASTMVRAIETANLIANIVRADFLVTDLLREAIPSIPPRIAEHILAMMEQDPDFTHQSIYDDQKRADEAFERYFIAPEDEDEHVVLSSHGNIIRYLTCKALGVNVDTWAKMNINHGSITTITVDEQGLMRLVNYNETGHLPRDILTD
ncbi:MAG: histidine phosphatase family protein [Chloroflexi bacterium]|nr:histidine phosphatase family protein [Chloroflexota bacterium]